jgi:hypothetical protein
MAKVNDVFRTMPEKIVPVKKPVDWISRFRLLVMLLVPDYKSIKSGRLWNENE